MLKQSPAGQNVANILFLEDETKIDLFEKIISSIPNETDEIIRESLVSLLPTEIQQHNTVLNAEYKILENDKFMVILTDITQERRMAEMLHKERLRLELIVLAVSDSRNFFDIVDAFRGFLMQLPDILKEDVSPQILAKILYLEIHTYKGLLNQFSFPNTPKILHHLESHLSELVMLDNTLSRTKIVETISSDVLHVSFDKDLAILTDALGENFLAHGESIILTCEQALQLEKLAIRLLSGEPVDVSVSDIRKLLNEISLLRKVSFKDVLIGFNGVVQQAASRMGKAVAPIIVKGGESIWIDPQTYQSFLRSLVHVFRNAVAHGIESPEVRWETEKDEMGKIICHVERSENKLKLTIADDGAGINLSTLRQRVVAAGICSETEIAQISDDEVTKFIFMDNISIQQGITELAGRGVGLAAVQQETNNLGGDVIVKTSAGQGTQFIFTLPLLSEILNEEVI